MIIQNRSYAKEAPTRIAKTIYIFCEGARREYQYFQFFSRLDSRIQIVVHKLSSDENNTPRGLFDIAVESISRIGIDESDEVWIISDFDIDKFKSRLPQIEFVKSQISIRNNWSFALSNPCFEVWLYYHFFRDLPFTEMKDTGIWWKSHLNSRVSGGFDSRKHPVLIIDAISNSSNDFKTDENKIPLVGCTEVYKLGISIASIAADKIKTMKAELIGMA